MMLTIVMMIAVSSEKTARHCIMNKLVRPRWPYDMRPSVRPEKYMCHCNSLGGAT